MASNPNKIKALKVTGYIQTYHLFAISVFRLSPKRFDASYRGSTAWFSSYFRKLGLTVIDWFVMLVASVP
jgi:hypothetical protein